jgi:cytochrome c5
VHRGILSSTRAALSRVAWLVAATGCASPPPPGPSEASLYLNDAAARRAALVASLVNPENGYSQLRLAHYATGADGDWDRLPEWNPPAEPIAAPELDAPGGASSTSLSGRAAPLDLPGAADAEDEGALLALGEAAFHRYPAQIVPYLSVALASRAAAAQYGLWVDDALGAGGLVRVRTADGSAAIAMTCSTCHAAPAAGAGMNAGAGDPAPGVVAGLPNARLNLGAAILSGSIVDPSAGAAIAAWGPGRLDVTTTTGREPVRIADLRPVRWLTHLQQDATVRQIDRTSLAIRVETLIVTSNGEAVRPPRVVALALAAYESSLADALPSADDAASAAPAGASVFDAHCTGCHQPPALTGPPVALSVVGTDPTLGESVVRGTGTYRVPSLHGVATRGPLLHDGTVPSIEAMFDPARVTPSFAGRLHGTGAVPGHPYGLDVTAADRAALLAFLGGL